MQFTQLVLLGVAAPGCALALGGCGGSAAPSDATTMNPSADASHHATQIEFSECMRSHGVRDFPDPNGGATPHSGPVVTVLGIAGIAQAVPSGANQQSPAFEHALAVCGGA
jgi:hypothetical protein